MLKNSDYEAAIEVLKKASEHRSMSSVHQTLADLLIKIHKEDEAVEHYTKALRYWSIVSSLSLIPFVKHCLWKSMAYRIVKRKLTIPSKGKMMLLQIQVHVAQSFLGSWSGNHFSDFVEFFYIRTVVLGLPCTKQAIDNSGSSPNFLASIAFMNGNFFQL